MKGALRKEAEEQGSAMALPTQPPNARHPCTAVPHPESSLPKLQTSGRPCPPPLSVSLCPPQFFLPTLDLYLFKHPFNPLAPYLLLPQPLSLFWLLASSFFP